jgi:hypothetical protein
MQHVSSQQREAPDRISWARAIIFACGYFFLAAILVGQVPSYVYNTMTSSTLTSFEQGTLSFGLTCLAGFAVVMIIALLFDPKPVVPPLLLTGVGVVLGIVGLAIAILAPLTGYHYFPTAQTQILPLLGGNFLWFQPDNIDVLAIGLVILFVGVAAVFYSVLAIGEQHNPDRRDLGATPAVRIMLLISAGLLAVFLYLYNYQVGPALVQTIIIGVAVFAGFGALALRLHYLMRPVRKRVMSGLYLVGTMGLAQIGAIFVLLWLVVYPLLALIHPWTFIGLGDFLTVCSRRTAIPSSCAFSQDAGYIVDTIISSAFFGLSLLAVAIWKNQRNTIVVSSIVLMGVIALSVFVLHTSSSDIATALMVAAGVLVVGTIWTLSSRREFAIVGENRLGCLGMTLLAGTCLCVYLAAFAFFSMPYFKETNFETVPNVPSVAQNAGATDAFVMFALFVILGLIQFFFLVRNRYRV